MSESDPLTAGLLFRLPPRRPPQTPTSIFPRPKPELHPINLATPPLPSRSSLPLSTLKNLCDSNPLPLAVRAAAAAFRAAECEHGIDSLSEGLTESMMKAADDVYKTPVMHRNVLFPSSSIRGGSAASGSSRAERGRGVRFSAGEERMELFGENEAYRRRFSNGIENVAGHNDYNGKDEVGDGERPVELYDNREGRENVVAEDITGEGLGTIGYSSMSELMDERGEGTGAPVRVKSEGTHVDVRDCPDDTFEKDIIGEKVPMNEGLVDNESDFTLTGCIKDSVRNAMAENDKTVTGSEAKVTSGGSSSREIKKEQKNELDSSSTKDTSKRKRPRLNEVLRLQKSLETARWTNAKAVREQSEVIIISDDELPAVKSGDSSQGTMSRRKRRRRKHESETEEDAGKSRERNGSVRKGRTIDKRQARAEKDELENVSSADEMETKLTEEEWEALLQGWVIERKIERDGMTDLKADKVKTMIHGPFGLGEEASKLIGELDERGIGRIRRRRIFEKNKTMANLDPERTDSEALSNEDVGRKVSFTEKMRS